jgi:hypothetical protein
MKSFTHEGFSMTLQVLSLVLMIGYGVSKSDDELIAHGQKVPTLVSESNALPIGSNHRFLIEKHKYKSILNKKNDMKKSILSLGAITFFVYTGLVSCSSTTEKVEDAKEEVVEANKDLDKANEEYLTDVENYRRESADKIATNERSIAEFKTRVANEKKEAKAEYQKKITDLEQKNTDMKKRMDDYKVEGKENWEKFKSEFKYDMDELGKAFKEFTVKSKK